MEILFSQRNAIIYLEHCRLVVKDGALCYIRKDKAQIRYWTIPYANVSVLLLGSGTSLTQQSARILASEGVMVSFCSGDGVQLYLASQSEYREPEYIRKWYHIWLDEARRFAVAKHFQYIRLDNVRSSWQKLNAVNDFPLPLDKMETINQRYKSKIEKAALPQELMGYEGEYTKSLFALLAKELLNTAFVREQHGTDLVNRNLDQSNYLAYGLGGSVLWVLGIPHSFPVSHGLTRKGALVFDIADMIKDACILPVAFHLSKQGKSDGDVRKKCIWWLDKFNALELLFDTMKQTIDKFYPDCKDDNSTSK